MYMVLWVQMKSLACLPKTNFINIVCETEFEALIKSIALTWMVLWDELDYKESPYI